MTDVARRRAFPSTPSLVAGQVRYQLLTFVRTPVALFFTILLPLIMLVLFNALFGGETVSAGNGGEWPLRQFYVGGLAAFSATSATFTNLANTVPIRREEGILKRWRSTPLPPWVCIAGFVGSAIVLALVGVVIMVGLGVAAYGIELDAGKLPSAMVTFVIAVGAFAALGIAIAAVIPSADSAPAVANAIILPLGFISNVFIQISDPPRWLSIVGDVFPLRHFALIFQDVFNPFVDAPAFRWDRLAVIAAWGVVGVLAAVRFFTWEPRRSAPAHRRGRSRRVTTVTQP